MPDLSDIEIKAEMFRIVRNHSDEKPKEIMRIIREVFPELTSEQIREKLRVLLK